MTNLILLNSELNTDDPVGSTDNQHQLAHLQMLEGNFYAAKSNLLKIENDVDAEVLIDLATCMYATQDINSFEDYTRKALKLYENTKNNISSEKNFSCRIKLGKLLEETGHVALSLKLYSEKIDCRSEFEQELAQQILAQRLRLACSYIEIDEVSRLYVQAEKAVSQNALSFLDLQFALIQSDIKMTGYHSAYNRLQKLIQNRSIYTDVQKQWVIFEFIFACLEEGHSDKIDLSIISEFNYHNVGLFEKIVWDLFHLFKSQPPVDNVDTSRTRGLSVLSALRILKLMTSAKVSSTVKEDANRKMKLMFCGLDFKSKQLLANRFFDETNLQSKTISLTRLESKIIQLICQNELTSLSHLSRHIYNFELNDSILNRLNVALSRLNSKIKKHGQFNYKVLVQDGFLIGVGEIPMEWKKC